MHFLHTCMPRCSLLERKVLDVQAEASISLPKPMFMELKTLDRKDYLWESAF